MGRLQILGIAVAILVPSGFLWVHEHDARVRSEVLSEQRRKELAFNDTQIEALRKSIEFVNTRYVEESKRYKANAKVVKDSLKKLDGTVAGLIERIKEGLPDSVKHLAVDVAEACKASVDLVQKQTTECERLKQEADSISHVKDTIIFRLDTGRNGYKKLYEDEHKRHNRGGNWATIGKVETGTGLLAILGRILHLW